MNRSIFSRSLLIFLIYTLVLISVLYALQRFLAPSLYYNAIIDDYQTITNSIIEQFEEGPLTLTDYQAFDNQIIPSLFVYNRQGGLIYPESGISLTPLQTVEIFQSAPFDIILEESTGYYIETFDTSGSTIFKLRSSVDAYVTNFNSLNQLFLILILTALMVMIPLSYGFAKTFSNPVVKLNKLASQLAKLDFDIQKSLNRKDEIGTLETTLKDMAISLKNTIDQLKEELEKEKELEKLQKQFIARVSHEIRTPLSIIRASVESLMGYINHKTDMDYESMINEEIDHLVHLTDDLLDLAQLESGRFNIKKESLDLKPLIHKITDSFLINTVRPIKVEFETPFYIQGDQKRLTQVFYNLLSNAINHSDIEGPIKIIQKEAYIIVENPKTTMDENTVLMLRKSFYKTQEKKQGYGLGLAIISAILEKHDIPMNLKSDQNQFRVTLDFSKVAHSNK
jgi:signal transduction histidine kinase